MADKSQAFLSVIAVFSEKFVKIIILLIKWSYVIGDIRSYHTALRIKNIKCDYF